MVSDDFIVVGCGNTIEEPTATMMFLERCKEQSVNLNTDRLNLRENEVPFIGYLSTEKYLRVDTEKLVAISEIWGPSVKEGI